LVTGLSPFEQLISFSHSSRLIRCFEHCFFLLRNQPERLNITGQTITHCGNLVIFGFTASPGDQVSEDLKHANPDIHWPAGFSPKTADLYAHNEIMIDAPVGVVFRHIQEAEKWPEWYANSQHVVIVFMAPERKTFGKKIPLSCTVGTNFGIPP
jgi:hypothetical protein